MGRPSLEQTAHELGVSPAEFKRVTKLADAVLVGEEGVRLVEHKTQPPRKPRARKRSRARSKRHRHHQQAAKRR